MHDWLALRGVAVVAALSAASLALIAGLIANGGNDVVVPPPEQPAIDFVQALKAHRFEGARLELSESERARIDTERLRTFVDALERQDLTITSIDGDEQSRTGDSAIVDVDIHFATSAVTVTLPMRREQGEWRIDSIAPLLALADPP